MRRIVLSFFVSVMACALSACGGRATPEPTGTPRPPSTPEPTYTLYPTYTPHPTYTPEPTYTPAPTSTPVPTRTVVPTSTPEPANTPTPFPVVSLGERVQTTGLLVTISEARRAEWLPRNGQTLEPASQWIIAYGEVRNLTAEPAWLYPEDFVLGVSSIGGYIFLSEDATEAAGLQSGIERTVAGTFGMDIPPGESAPVALAFDVSDVVGQTTLWVVDARAGIALGSIGQIASLWTPTPTGTPIPTNTPTSTPTPTALPNVPLDATRAQLIGLVDGDTIEVLVNGQAETVRYIGIDTPERTQPGYEAATEANRTLLSAGPIYLVRDRSDRDRYDRLLRYVYTADGTFVNAEMVAQGRAQPVEYPPDTLHAAEFRQLAREAAEAGRGFWSGTSPYDGAMSYGLVTRTANIRRGPGTEFAVSGGATAGTPLTIFGRNPIGDWLQVRTPDRSGGWIHASLVQVNVPIATIPVPGDIPVTPTSSAVPTQPPATEPPPTQPPAPPSAGNVIIAHIFYNGAVYRVESDEYVEITNTGSTPVDLAGWRINADDPGQDFWFPSFIIQPGQSCRIYTNEHHPETCGFSFGSGTAIWNNKGDCGHLYDAAGAEVSTRCY